jgi:hypothetical protein
MDEPLRSELAVFVLMRMPPLLRAAVITNDGFRRRYDLATDATLTIGVDRISFVRSVLFKAVRDVFSGVQERVTVSAKDGAAWHLARSGADPILTLFNGDRTLQLPDMACLGPDPLERLAWLDRASDGIDEGDRNVTLWQTVLADRPLADDEVEKALRELSASPRHFIESVDELLREDTLRVDTLVPNEILYFERLIGSLVAGVDVDTFIEQTLQPHLRHVMTRNPRAGALQALAVAWHPSIGASDAFACLNPSELMEICRAVRDHGDPVSRAAALEVGFRRLEHLPELEPVLREIASRFVGDALATSGSGFQLLSSLAVLVGSELARTGFLRHSPPYWRRLATLAHATILARAFIDADLDVSAFSEWAERFGGRFHLQGLIDLRREPRWFPLYISPDQLIAELSGRVLSAAEAVRSDIQDSGFNGVLWGDGQTVESAVSFPASFFAGPLEGGGAPRREMPVDISAGIRGALQGGELTRAAITGLVNSAALFETPAEFTKLVASNIRGAKYHFSGSATSLEASGVLVGVARLCALTRDTDLADALRVLARVSRSRFERLITTHLLVEVCLTAAAAHSEFAPWSKFVGEWLGELAMGDLSRGEAISLQREIREMCALEPSLWAACGRAEAACTAWLESLPPAAHA